MWKYALLISYHGAEFCGWQKQKELTVLPSIQSTLEQALERITGEQCSVVGSGRTDAGVHAAGQVAHFVLKAKEWETWILQRALNSHLPVSIRIRAVQQVPLDFHAQRSAVRKQYSYYFQQGPSALAHLEPMSWWIYKQLDVSGMDRAIQSLKGEHDFKAFQARGSKPGSTVRAMLEVDVTRIPIGFPAGLADGFHSENNAMAFVRVRLVGTGFLKQMVRGIAGTLLQIGESRRPVECMEEVLRSQERSKVGPTAPARALWLEKVWYPDEYRLWQ